MKTPLLEGEFPLLQRIAWNASDEDARISYAMWLSGKDDVRSEFLHGLIGASKSMVACDFPKIPTGVSEEWVELVGYRLLEIAAAHGYPELRSPLLNFARPGLRMFKAAMNDTEIPVGASKIGGEPDLPQDFAWPAGKACRAIYNDDTAAVEKPAGFLMQVNLSEIASTQAARDLPNEGLLSFFSYVNWKNPDIIGAMAAYFPQATSLVRTATPQGITQGNRAMTAQRLEFVETLDVPGEGGPWEADLHPHSTRSDADFWTVYRTLRDLNEHVFLGYAKCHQEADPTPSKDSRHLVMAENVLGQALHLQIPASELAVRNFDAITLNWVDFD